MWPFKKIRINTRNRKEREISFLGITVFQYGRKESDGGKETYFKVFPKSFEHRALDKIISFLPKNNAYDHVWIVRVLGLGEAHLLNFMLDEFSKKSGVKNICLMSQRAIYADMFAMYSNFPFFQIKLDYEDFALYLRKRFIKYRKKSFYVFHCTPDESWEWLKKHRGGDSSHTIEAIKKWWNISNFTHKQASFPRQIRDSAVSKVQKSGLNTGNFVYLSPESNGSESVPMIFWELLVKHYSQRGLDVFVNTATGKFPLGKSCQLSIAESVYVASLACEIVALRCGFVEILAAVPKKGKMHVIYTSYKPFLTHDASFFYKVYSLKEYPFWNSMISEYIYDKNHLELLKKITTNE